MSGSPGTILPARVTFFPAKREDFEELTSLRIAAMRESLERVGRFDPVRARERLLKSFYPEETDFIRLDGENIGFYTFRRIEDGFSLDHLYVLPGYQSRGIGSVGPSAFAITLGFTPAGRSPWRLAR